MIKNEIVFRPLKHHEISKFTEINRFERIEEIYYHRDNELIIEKEYYTIEQFSNINQDYLDVLTECYDNNGILIGAFEQHTDHIKLIGLGSMGGNVIKGTKDILQLEHLYINSSHRHQGVGKKIVSMLKDEAKRLGAKKLYVSSIPTKSSVDFYRSVGFELTMPIKELLELEPEDIHMGLVL